MGVVWAVYLNTYELIVLVYGFSYISFVLFYCNSFLVVMKSVKWSKTWNTSSIISDCVGEEERYVKNVENLLRSDHTIPFIARYRKEMTGDMSTDKLYKIKEQLNRLDNLTKKIEKSIKDIEKLGSLTPNLSEAIAACTSATMLEQVTAAYKPGKKKSKSEQARNAGLGSVAEQLIDGRKVDFNTLVGSHAELKSVKNVIDGTKDILIDIRNIGNLKHFQVMAINRGENLKALSVKIDLSQNGIYAIKQECTKVLSRVLDNNLKHETVEDACTRLIFPMVCRRTRSWLTEAAVESSIDVFADNLKHLLLTRPVKGINIMAIDPGYKHGCKVAVLDHQGKVLKTDVVYLQNLNSSAGKAKESRFRAADEDKLQKLQVQLRFKTIAIGNGTACRETETSVTKMISEKKFCEGTQYTVIDERGASVYSVTPLAQQELPKLDTNLRSAVSLGRRVLEPLSEYVKIEPQHLGVGQYQHDIAQKKLSSRLEDIVSEAVSFTGVDINTCSLHMLQKIAGLTKARAQAILDTRDSVGYFRNREQIKSIKGIGPKSYEQCIGFLRIYPNQLTKNPEVTAEYEDVGAAVKGKRKLTSSSSAKSKLMKRDVAFCFLDQTSVHPESYHIASALLKEQGLKERDIGTEEFVQKIKQLNPVDVSVSCSEGTKQCILSALSQRTDTDYRDQFARPIFKSTVLSAESLVVGTQLEGRVSNVTHFGAFVDVGVERDGLIHTSKMNGYTVCLGNRVRVKVERKDQKGIGLYLLQVL
ncbi:hypothetical protein ACHWQZ_G014940 [Mnemiopsis leidyi]